MMYSCTLQCCIIGVLVLALPYIQAQDRPQTNTDRTGSQTGGGSSGAMPRDAGTTGDQTECKYKNSKWSECDTATNERTRTLTLKKKSGEDCEKEKVEVKACKTEKKSASEKANSKCKYADPVWGDCDPQTKTKNLTKAVLAGSEASCKPKIKSKKCNPCSYEKGTWSECDTVTATKTYTRNLQAGSASFCNQTTTKTLKCRPGEKDCRYEKAEWGECDTDLGEMKRVRVLKAKSEAGCEQEKVDIKPCKKPKTAGAQKKCAYEKSEWSDCLSGEKEMVLTLNQSESEETCKPRKVKTKKC